MFYCFIIATPPFLHSGNDENWWFLGRLVVWIPPIGSPLRGIVTWGVTPRTSDPLGSQPRALEGTDCYMAPEMLASSRCRLGMMVIFGS